MHQRGETEGTMEAVLAIEESACESQAFSPREPGRIRGAGTQDSGLPITETPVATGNWVTLAVGPGTLFLQLLRCL